MVNIHKYINALLHPDDGHQVSHKAHQAGNLRITEVNIITTKQVMTYRLTVLSGYLKMYIFSINVHSSTWSSGYYRCQSHD